MASNESEGEIERNKGCGCFAFKRVSETRTSSSSSGSSTRRAAAAQSERQQSPLSPRQQCDCVTDPTAVTSIKTTQRITSSSSSSEETSALLLHNQTSDCCCTTASSPTLFPSTRSAFYRDKTMIVDEKRRSEAYTPAGENLDLTDAKATLNLRRKSSGYSSNSSSSSSTTGETRSLLNDKQQHGKSKLYRCSSTLGRLDCGSTGYGSLADVRNCDSASSSCKCIPCSSGCLPKLSCNRSNNGATSKWKFTRSLSSHLRRRHHHQAGTLKSHHHRSSSYPQAYCDEKKDDSTACFLRLLFANHVCMNSAACQRKNSHMTLNYHLRCISDSMPRSFNDDHSSCASDQRDVFVDGVDDKEGHCDPSQQDKLFSYLSHRRHAVCETSEDMRQKFHEALTNFMKLKALVRYDLL